MELRKWVFIRSQLFFRRGKRVAIRSNNFQISPKMGCYNVSRGFVQDLITTPLYKDIRKKWGWVILFFQKPIIIQINPTLTYFNEYLIIYYLFIIQKMSNRHVYLACYRIRIFIVPLGNVVHLWITRYNHAKTKIIAIERKFWTHKNKTDFYSIKIYLLWGLILFSYFEISFSRTFSIICTTDLLTHLSKFI